MRGPLAALAVACTLAGAACNRTAPPPTFSNRWPDRPGDYEVVHRSWTRHGTIYDGYDKALEVYATFKSPEWRAARARWLTREQRLTAGQQAALMTAEQKANAEGYELELLVTTYEDRENDLVRGDKSVWRMHLVDDRGRAIAPSDIDRDRRPPNVLRSEYPALGDFAAAYVVRFPRTYDLLGDSNSVRLRIAGVRGTVDLVWAR